MNEKVSFREWFSFMPEENRYYNTWYRKTFQRPQRSRHNRIKRGRK